MSWNFSLKAGSLEGVSGAKESVHQAMLKCSNSQSAPSKDKSFSFKRVRLKANWTVFIIIRLKLHRSLLE